jgi:predicted O-methyltransferase YrrM
VKRRWGLLLYVLAREVAPKICIELGTCFGLSGLYMLAAQRHAGGGRFVTFEGSRARAEIARRMYRDLGFDDVTIVVGDFDRTVAPTLAKMGHIDLAFIDGNHRLEPTLRYDALVREHGAAGTVIVQDDIRWSAEMIEAWRQVRARGGARIFDAFRVGIVELDSVGAQPSSTVDAWLGWSHLR